MEIKVKEVKKLKESMINHINICHVSNTVGRMLITRHIENVETWMICTSNRDYMSAITHKSRVIHRNNVKLTSA